MNNANVIRMKNVVHTIVEPDMETGELVPVRQITREIKSQDVFMKMYTDDLAPIIKCTNAEKNLILCLTNLKFIEYNTNELVLNASRREQVSNCAGIKIPSLNNSISKMIKKDVFIRDGRKIILNPKYFFLGEERARAKVLEFRIRYKMPTS